MVQARQIEVRGPMAGELGRVEKEETELWQNNERMLELLDSIQTGRFDLSPYKDHLREAGFDSDEVRDERVFQRMAFLDQVTPTLDDEKKCIWYAHTIADHLETIGQGLTEEELKTITVGTLFTDIGKTGPADATPEEVVLITSMYAYSGNYDIKKVTVKEFLREHFPAEARGRIEIFEGMDLDPMMTMREFYNLHVHWTYDIVIDSGLPKEAVFAAATHHITDGKNPRDIVDSQGVLAKL